MFSPPRHTSSFTLPLFHSEKLMFCDEVVAIAIAIAFALAISCRLLKDIGASKQSALFNYTNQCALKG